MKFIAVMMLLPVAVSAEGNCKDILTGFLSGQSYTSPLTQELDVLRKKMRTMSSVMSTMQNKIKTLKGYVDQSLSQRNGKSVMYTRWGRKKCPSSAELVYSGYTGGSYYSHKGGAAEYVCLPKNPQWGIHVDGQEGNNAYMYGTEYEWDTLKDSRYKRLHDHDVPCAVCWKKGPSVVHMIPARTQCYKGWKTEYQGYLMAGYYDHPSATQYVCVDRNPESLHAGHLNKNGRLMYKVEAVCGSLQCPPYVKGRELTCVVCTR